jgi:hypothetical protein
MWAKGRGGGGGRRRREEGGWEVGGERGPSLLTTTHSLPTTLSLPLPTPYPLYIVETSIHYSVETRLNAAAVPPSK